MTKATKNIVPRTAITILTGKERDVVAELGSVVFVRGVVGDLVVEAEEDCVIVVESVEEDVGDAEMEDEACCCGCCCCA